MGLTLCLCLEGETAGQGSREPPLKGKIDAHLKQKREREGHCIYLCTINVICIGIEGEI